MNTTENTIATIHQNIAELIGVFGGWNVNVSLDDVGTYISITNPENAKDYRGLTLSDEEGSDNLSQYRWQFWNTKGAWYDSPLGADAGAEDILEFLKDCLMEENLFTEESRAMTTSL
jgi:hypothetical protein